MTEAIPSLVALALAAAAAFTDWRTGLIPNRLTVPPLALAPVIYFFLGGVPAAVASVLGAVLCGAVPYVLFRRDAIGGGDVKLLAALGAFLGPSGALLSGLVGIALGGVLAFAMALAGGFGRQVVANLGASITTLTAPLAPRRARAHVVPLAVPLAVGCVAVHLVGTGGAL